MPGTWRVIHRCISHIDETGVYWTLMTWCCYLLIHPWMRSWPLCVNVWHGTQTWKRELIDCQWMTSLNYWRFSSPLGLNKLVVMLGHCGICNRPKTLYIKISSRGLHWAQLGPVPCPDNQEDGRDPELRCFWIEILTIRGHVQPLCGELDADGMRSSFATLRHTVTDMIETRQRQAVAIYWPATYSSESADNPPYKHKIEHSIKWDYIGWLQHQKWWMNRFCHRFSNWDYQKNHLTLFKLSTIFAVSGNMGICLPNIDMFAWDTYLEMYVWSSQMFNARFLK